MLELESLNDTTFLILSVVRYKGDVRKMRRSWRQTGLTDIKKSGSFFLSMSKSVAWG